MADLVEAVKGGRPGWGPRLPGGRNVFFSQKKYGTIDAAQAVADEKYAVSSPKIDRSKSPLSASERAALGIKMTPTGKASYLASLYGEGNVHRLGDDFFVSPGGDKSQWLPVDPNTLSLGEFGRDISDLSGAALEIAPAIGTGLATANPLAIAAAAAGGNVMRQGISEMIPGEEDFTQLGVPELGRVTGPVISGALGGATQKVANVGFNLIDKYLRPSNYLARMTQGPEAARGRVISQKSGIPLSVGEETGSRFGRMLEGGLRQSFLTADKARRFYSRQLEQSLTKLDDILGKVDPTRPGEELAGSRISDAFNAAVNSALDLRRQTAKRLFGAVDKVGGNRNAIPTGQIVDKIDDLISQLDVPGAGDATATLITRLKALRKEYVPTFKDKAGKVVELDPISITGSQAGRLLSIWSTAAKGSGQVFKDIDKGQQRWVAREVLEGLNGALDDAVETGGAGSAAAEALRIARDAYRQDSQLIKELGQTTIGRLFNSPVPVDPASLVQRVAKMSGSELKRVLPILAREAPDVLPALRHSIISNALNKAQAPATALVPEGGMMGAKNVVQREFSPAKFLTALPDNEVLRSIFTGRELVELRFVSHALKRISDKAGMAGSQTAPLQQVSRLLYGSIAATGVGALIQNRLANVLLSSAGRKAVMQITRTGTKPRTMTAAAATIMELAGKEGGGATSLFPETEQLSGDTSLFPGPPQLSGILQ